MNVSELARQLHIPVRDLFEILPQYGYDIGVRAVKIDDRVAGKIIQQWKFIKKDIDAKRRAAAEEEKKKTRELRKQSGQQVSVPSVITVREFAERLRIPVVELITELMKNGILANQNQHIDAETAVIIGGELGFDIAKEGEDTAPAESFEGESSTAIIAELSKTSQDLSARAPVVVVMGHVDHGKTKLLDTIRETNVVASESGGITQHIGAYQTMWKDPKTKTERAITFIDTPGHEAFTVMRSRGAKVADIAILVVAADDGVKPQTKEVIQIIRAAKLPFIVAINKIDKETADPQRVRSELSTEGIVVDDWGGDVPVVELSAKNKLNIDKLLDVLLLVSDMRADDMRADATVPAVGTIIESHKDKNMGPVATVLVQYGTLKKGDPLVVNNEIYGKARSMRTYQGKDISEAGPSVPVQIIGFKVAPQVGDVLDVSKADTAEAIDVREKSSKQNSAERYTVLAAQAQDGEEEAKKTINLVVKADVLGSLEAIIDSLEKIKHDEVGVKIVGKGLGNVTEDDVKKAEAAGGVVAAFHVGATSLAEETMRDKGISFQRYTVIYDLINFVKNELEKMLDAEKIVHEVGIVKILAIFRTDRGAMTIGGRVEDGKVTKGCMVRVKRKGNIIGEGKITECQQGKSPVKEVPGGTECGMRFEGKVIIEEGDVLECYTVESKTRKIQFLP